jgi:thiol:disulfide interchange protein
MNLCPQCGTDNEFNAKFCQCGEQLSKSNMEHIRQMQMQMQQPQQPPQSPQPQQQSQPLQPQQSQPPPSYSGGGGGGKTNPFAEKIDSVRGKLEPETMTLAAMICGIAAVLLGCLLPVLGIILGVLALGAAVFTKMSGAEAKGKLLVGFICGGVGILVGIGGLISEIILAGLINLV